eukprot:gene9270-10872_t
MGSAIKIYKIAQRYLFYRWVCCDHVDQMQNFIVGLCASSTDTITMDKLVSSLKEEFNQQGFNIVEPFMVNDYNGAAKHKLDNFDQDNALGLIIGCNMNFWDHFVRYMKRIDHIPKDPMNSFCKDTIEAVLANNAEASAIRHQVRYDWNSVASGKYVHIQTAGHFAGIAYYDRDVMWSIHPEFGLWFVYRAIVIFDTPFTAPRPAMLPSLFDQQTKDEMLKWTNVAIDEGWCNLETRLKIRECCPLGRDNYMYQGDMFDYFYPIKRSAKSVLQGILGHKGEIPSNKSEVTSSSQSACSAPASFTQQQVVYTAEPIAVAALFN